LGLLNWWNNVFFVSLLITFYLFSLSIAEIYRYSDLNKFLAKIYTSIIIKTLEKNTILPLEVLQRSLKVEEANKKHFENLIDRVCSEAEKLGDPTAIYKGYVFFGEVSGTSSSKRNWEGGRGGCLQNSFRVTCYPRNSHRNIQVLNVHWEN
jgi:hypothetical protein